MFVVMAIGCVAGLACPGRFLHAGITLTLVAAPPLGAWLSQRLEEAALAWLGPALVWFALPLAVCHGVRAARQAGWRTLAGVAAGLAIAEGLVFAWMLMAAFGFV